MGREVAIKISAAKFTERFSREVHAVAAVNHINVCHVYDVGPDYLVMELVEGPTLAERIKEGPIPLEEALLIARQIADGVEAAHEKGITHRDLKPGNIKIKPDGTVKVLDFGLAKVGPGTASGGGQDPENSPTISMAATQAGVILGTAAYMAPEQARGKPVDKRADIWAFGVVLYEMVTGKRLFQGEDLTETIASVVRDKPDLSAVPRRIRRLIEKCLEKDPKKRLRDIGDVMTLVDEERSEAEVPAQRRWRPARAGLVALTTLFALTTLAFGFLYFRKPQPPPALQNRYQIPLPDKANVATFAISPDGRRLVFLASPGSTSQLWIRSLDSLESHPLPDTEGAGVLPFWSPDSRYIAFESQGKLKKIDASGGPAQTICDLGGPFAGGSWSRDGVILFASPRAGIMRVPASGGTPSLVTSLDASDGEVVQTTPFFLPDGRHFVYTAFSPQSGRSGAYAGSRDAQPKDQSHQRLVATSATSVYVPSPQAGNGQLLFLRDGTLVAQTLDTKRLELTGEPIPVAENVGIVAPSTPVGLFAASENGVLIYLRGSSSDNSQLTWYDRQGKMLGAAGDPEPYDTMTLSPDGTRAAVTRDGDVWVVDLMRGSSTRLTTSGTVNQSSAIWSPDSTHIAYTANPGGV
jgi:eukaryotic-like serine/threonine-protein kinase